MANFEQLLVKAKKQLHFNERKLNNDSLEVFNPLEEPVVDAGVGKKKKGWLKARLLGDIIKRGEEQIVTSSPAVHNGKKGQKKAFSGALETLEEEEARGDVEVGPITDPAASSRGQRAWRAFQQVPATLQTTRRDGPHTLCSSTGSGFQNFFHVALHFNEDFDEQSSFAKEDVTFSANRLSGRDKSSYVSFAADASFATNDAVPVSIQQTETAGEIFRKRMEGMPSIC